VAPFLARQGKSKKEIRSVLEELTGYDLGRRLDDIRPSYVFTESCQGTVPESIVAFLESEDYEDAVRKAISLGATRTRWHALRAPLQRRFTAVCRNQSQRWPWVLLDAPKTTVLDFLKRYAHS